MNCGLARGELDTAVDHDLILDLLVSHLWIQAPSATASRPSASLTERCASATTARGSTLTAHRARGPSLQREEVMTPPDQATYRGTATGPTGHQQPAMPRPRCSAFPVQLVHAVCGSRARVTRPWFGLPPARRFRWGRSCASDPGQRAGGTECDSTGASQGCRPAGRPDCDRRSLRKTVEIALRHRHPVTAPRSDPQATPAPVSASVFTSATATPPITKQRVA
jgi:hypothetical protein